MQIVVLGYENCLGLGFVGAVDMLALSRTMLAKKGAPEPYRVIAVSHDGLPIRDGAGRRYEVEARFDEVDGCAAIIVPGYVCDGGHALPPFPAIGAAAAWLRRQHALGAIVAGSCNGVFLLGEAGLLDGRRCTTTWWRHNELKTRYPRADAAWGASLIEDGRIVTAGGPLSWIDLSLHIIRALLATRGGENGSGFHCRRYGSLDSDDLYSARTSLGLESLPVGSRAHCPPSRRRAADDDRVGARAGRFRANASPPAERCNRRNAQAFLDRLRFDTARTLLETTRNSVKQLAAASGYADETSFRRAFRRYSGMTPGAYRSWSQARRGIK